MSRPLRLCAACLEDDHPAHCIDEASVWVGPPIWWETVPCECPCREERLW